MITLEKTIRETEVTVYFDKFDGDPSVGINFGPEEVWAEDKDGKPFELTDQEIQDLSMEAVECYHDQDPPDGYTHYYD